MKIIITEKQRKDVFEKFRKISEIKESIEYQIEKQDPCDFTSGDDYATTCIKEGIKFYFPNYKKKENPSSETEKIYQLMVDDYFYKLKFLWNKHSKNCN
jgi:hypothetical protein